MKKQCILTKNYGKGGLIFYYDIPQTNDNAYNYNNVYIYSNPNDDVPFLICDKNSVIEIPENEIETVVEDKFVSTDFFRKIYSKWNK